MSKILKISTLILAIKILTTILSVNSIAAANSPSAKYANTFTISVRFDPGYLYASEYAAYGNSFQDKQSRERLQNALIAHWRLLSVNRVYLLMHNPEYGLNFSGQYPLLFSEQGLGQSEFMAELIFKIKQAGMEPWAWFYFLQDKAAWQAKPQWRLDSNREAKQPYLLTPSDPKTLHWYAGLLKMVLQKYPALSGIDLAEPIGCANSETPCNSLVLMRALRAAVAVAKKLKRDVSITPLIQVDEIGQLFSAKELKKRIGFDWTAFIKNNPGVEIFPQLQFQEWRQSPEWSRMIYQELRRRHGHSFPLGVHLEFSSFRSGEAFVAPALLTLAVQELSKEPHLSGIDLYDSHLAWQLLGPPKNMEDLKFPRDSQ